MSRPPVGPVLRPASKEVPSYFAGGLFGWFHLPEESAARDLGVVICKPFGYEAMCVHRSLRHLAARLADAGLPTLRFDLPGTGDSAGDMREPGLLAAWLSGIASAAEALRVRTGVTRICLLGLRLGGTLAAQAAVKMGGVEALVLWAPYRSGRLFVREQRAMAALQATSGPSEEGVIDVVGFPLTTEMQEGLSAIDLSKFEVSPARRVLVAGRDDLGGEDSTLLQRLTSLGANVEGHALPGYAAMMRDTNDSVVPEAALAQLSDWCRQVAGDPVQLSLVPKASEGVTLSQAGVEVREEPVRFGDRGELFGIATTPAGAAPGETRPGVVFVNVGANHHVGPNRMYAAMARQLAARGHRVLRFDVAGVGDSPAAPGAGENELYSMAHTHDLKAAVDLMESRGATGAAVIGLCSGAYLGFHTAIDEPRVRALTLINQQTFQWKPTDSLALVTRRSVKGTRFYKKAVFEWHTWKRLLLGRVHVWAIASALAGRLGRRLQQHLSALRSLLSGGPYEHSEIGRKFHALLRRGTQVQLIFSGNDGGLDVMEEHLGAGAQKLKGRPGFKLEVIDGPDHTFTPGWSQRRLAELLQVWVDETSRTKVSAGRTSSAGRGSPGGKASSPGKVTR